MPGKRMSASVIFLSVAATVCVTSCKDSRPAGLRFVGNRGSKPSQVTYTGIVIVTHGWIEKSRGDWPEYMAVAIYNRVDANSWLCGHFDWSDGAKSVNPTRAAEYARNVAGPKLAEEFIKTAGNCRHIHLIGHSCGCWAVSEAAKILAQKTKADIHLTFFDAYVPAFWDESSLGDVKTAADVSCWTEHYYTRDLTLGWTQQDLSFAHNVDITNIDGVFRDHNFPWQWYYASITGSNFSYARKTVGLAGEIEYGFARSREATGSDSWQRSLKLPTGNKAVKLKETQE